MVAECGQWHHTLLHPAKSTNSKDSKGENEKKPKEIFVQREATAGQCSATAAR